MKLFVRWADYSFWITKFDFFWEKMLNLWLNNVFLIYMFSFFCWFCQPLQWTSILFAVAKKTWTQSLGWVSCRLIVCVGAIRQIQTRGSLAPGSFVKICIWSWLGLFLSLKSTYCNSSAILTSFCLLQTHNPWTPIVLFFTIYSWCRPLIKTTSLRLSVLIFWTAAWE